MPIHLAGDLPNEVTMFQPIRPLVTWSNEDHVRASIYGAI